MPEVVEELIVELSTRCRSILSRVREKILEEPEALYMDCWEPLTSGQLQAQHLKPARCGTVCCIAGWVVQLAGQSPGQHAYDAARENLGLDVHRASRLFYVDNWPREFLPTRYVGGSVDLRGRPPLQSLEYARIVAERISRFIETDGRE